MKILFSAYACSPSKGSESEVGWRWGLEALKQGHDVYVITRKNNKDDIENYLKNTNKIQKLKFIYYDLPAWAMWWKKGSRGIRFYYLLWQIGAYLEAKKVHSKVKFECVHHVTFVSLRQPSFMGNLGIPFIFGPVGGGESAPWRLRYGYGFKGFFFDLMRDMSNFIIKFDPLMWLTFFQANKIFVTSEQTKNLLPNIFKKKVSVQLAIGIDSFKSKKCTQINLSKNCNILYVGRFLDWKGMALGFEAFASLLKKKPEVRLTLVGKGPEEMRWKKLAIKLGISEKINWINWLKREELPKVFYKHDLFLYPSLHDSGAFVVLEAIAHGLPVVCLNLGGPGIIVDKTCGIAVPVIGRSKQEVVDSLTDGMFHIIDNFNLYKCNSYTSRQKILKFSWKKIFLSIYNKGKIS